MRLFIAISVTDEIRQAITHLVQGLEAASRKDGDKIKWIEPSRCHLTLKFLGECGEERLPEIVAALESAVCDVQPFRVTLGGLGCFPATGAPGVLWVGMTEGANATTRVAAALEEAYEPLGFAKEDRPFSAHLTVGRVKGTRKPAQLRNRVESHKVEPIGSTTVTSVGLIRSVLSSAGPTYTTLHTATFNTPNG